MASVFGHAISAITVSDFASKKYDKVKLTVLAIICSILPDADIIMFKFGYSYSHWLGHRGFSHSIVFAIFIALLIKIIFYSKYKFFSRDSLYIILIFSFITASHGFLDAMTTGGKGIAFFHPLIIRAIFYPGGLFR